MKKVVVISALCMGGVGLMAFKPFKVNTVPLKDVTVAYNTGKLFNSMGTVEFSDYSELGHTSYPDGKQVDWSKHYEPKEKKISPSKVDKVEKVLKNTKRDVLASLKLGSLFYKIDFLFYEMGNQ